MTSKANEIEKIDEMFLAKATMIQKKDGDEWIIKKQDWNSIIKYLTDKFYIIPKTDNPKKYITLHIPTASIWFVKEINEDLKFKWRKQ